MDIPYKRSHVMKSQMAAILLPVLTAMSTLLHQGAAQGPTEISGEFCFLDDFSASCNRSDVILMLSANYGRMRAGRCIQGEVGFLGCSKDILPYMDRICSGRSSCSLPVLKLRELFNACSKELLSYLDVTYICQPISDGDTEECSRRNESRVDKGLGVMFSGTAFSSIVGTSACPWFIQALPGQQIKFTLFDFTLRDTSRSISSSGTSSVNRAVTCAASLVVLEKSGEKISLVLCNGSDRQKHVYTTVTSATHVWLVYHEKLEETPYFLLSYEAVGCPIFSPPEHMWVTVDQDIATVVCNYTGETWYLICRDTHWVGELGNCTKITSPPPGGPNPSDFPWGILIAVGIGVAIGTVVGLALLGLVFLCRRCICPPKRKPVIPSQQPSLTARDVPPMNELIRSATVMAKQGDPRASTVSEVHAQPHPYSTHRFSHQVEYHPQGPVTSREQDHVYESYIYKDGTIRSRKSDDLGRQERVANTDNLRDPMGFQCVPLHCVHPPSPDTVYDCKDSASESTGSGYQDMMEGSSVSDFTIGPIGPPMAAQQAAHVTNMGQTTAHPGGGELDK